MNTFTEHLDRLIQETQERSPSYGRDHWNVSGRKTREWPEGNNEAWWREAGPSMVDAYADWRTETGWDLWQVDGEPAIEVECNFDLPGDVRIKAFIDRVFVFPNGDLCVTDIKSGAREPDHPLQLAIYACGVEARFGIRPTWGNFWMARTGAHTAPQHLDRWTPAVMGEMFSEFIAGVNAGAFPPKPSSFCNSCSVADHCFAVGGAFAPDSDPLAQIAV